MGQQGTAQEFLPGTLGLRFDALTRYITSPDLLRRVAECGCEVASATYASVVSFRGDGKVDDFATKGVAFERRCLPTGGADLGIFGEARRRRQPVRHSIDDDPSLVGLPRSHGPVHILAAPLFVVEDVIGAILVARDANNPGFDDRAEDSLAAFAGHAGLALENARLRAESRSWRPALAAVNEVSHALLEGRPTDDVLMLIARSARGLLGAALTTVGAVEASGSIVVRAADGYQAERVEGRRISERDSASGDVMRARRPLVVADIAESGRHRQLTGISGFGPALLVPMVVGDKAFGTLAVMNFAGDREFTAEDVLVVQAFAAEAAIALEHEQIKGELDRLALLEERERIAMELHDGVVQALFVVGLSLQAAESVVEDTEQMRTRLGDAIDSIDRAIRDLRHYIFGLRPADLADRHLERALREVTKTVERSGRVSTSVDLDPRAATALAQYGPTIIQAAREAVSNALKHSGGDRVVLRFVCDGDHGVLEVTDNGSGFDVVHFPSGGHGLVNLQSRAEDMGGTFEIDSAPGEGTRIRIRVPFPTS